MQTEYYVEYPRGFANEYRLIAVDNADDKARVLALFPNAKRISWQRTQQLARRQAFDTTIPLKLAILLDTQQTFVLDDEGRRLLEEIDYA
jgi:hypothetical protein